jgi:hypothetical protein
MKYSLLGLTALPLAACTGGASPFHSAMDAQTGSTLQTPIFGPGTTTGDPTTPQSTNPAVPVTTTSTGNGPTIPVNLLCSNKATLIYGDNVFNASKVQVSVVDSQGAAVCTIPDERSTIMTSKSLDLTSCTLDQSKTYSIQVVDSANPSVSLLPTTVNGSKSDLLKNVGTLTYSHGAWAAVQITLLYDTNPQQGGGNAGNSGDECTSDQSPLIISTAEVNRMPALDLTSQDQGVWFNLMGLKALPTANALTQVSWFTNDNYGFLALPDENNQINGIDQLFGNNTQGPDGAFAANGFLALGKYDSNGDGFLNAKDPVFSRLRVWVDTNRDGIAQPEEIHTLAEYGITQIQLKYNKNFSETDIYGNRIVYRSIAKDSDGKHHLIFDLWFKVSTAAE